MQRKHDQIGLKRRVAEIRARFVLVLLLSGCTTAFAGARPDKVSYNREIRPILSENCFFCHGPDEKKRKAKLRLDIREQALSKNAFVPGQPDKSELIRRIFTADADDLMPPPASHKTLTQAQKQLLRRWIAQGAEYEKHWAYVAPVKAPVPATANGIDFLVQQRQKEIGLKFSPEADRRALARRLWFDLVGLPPRPEEVIAFEQDRSPGAYSNLVEKLLSSPHYGERMALGWLDAVRYADTIGYHSDNPRNVWPYRDYVIRSFNEDKPFNRFTCEQIAGDLMPDSGQEQKVGSAFTRLLLTTEEGGAQPKDYEARMLTDRVRALSTVWLGQTIGCAQCHDHKFDPITSRDFYSLGAFFADIREANIGHREEGMLVPDAKQTAELARMDAEIGRFVADYEGPRAEAEKRWEEAALEAIAGDNNWTRVKPGKMVSDAGVKLKIDTNLVISTEKDPKEGKDTYRLTLEGVFKDVAGLRLEVLSSEKLPGHGPGRSGDGSFVLSQVSLEDVDGNAIGLSKAVASFEAAGFPAAAALETGDNKASGWSIKGVTGVEQAIYFTLKNPITSDAEAKYTLVIKQVAGDNQVLGQFRLATTTNAEALRVRPVVVPRSDVAEVIRTSARERTPEQQKLLAEYRRNANPELIEQRKQLAEARKTRATFEMGVPRCLVAVAETEPHLVRILPRGDWMNESGDIVQPALPAYLVSNGGKLRDRRLTRLDLAEWIVSRQNPLTARVYMNRVWKQFFGIGISKVLEDFGMQGEPPVNPELLDWLASEFIDSGWDVKHMVRLIVNSSTYKQVSIASKELQIRDPYNRELARQSRWRLDAELVRDNALSVAGLLVPRIGGPSVKPYQPDGYWENLNFPTRTYEADTGESQYRRGLYTWWQRTFLHPSLLAFDAPSREECTAERNRSNIPQQALVLLNDPTYVEAARAFAGRIISEGGTDAEARIQWACRQALSRSARRDEMGILRSLLSRHLEEYRRDPQAAEAYLKVGLLPRPQNVDPAELAAWTNVARVILNLHETITRS